MDYKDYYKVLKLDRTATQDEIKRAYRKLVRTYHPDVNPDAEAQFKDVGEAYEVLGDPEKRAAYDTLGANWKDGQAFRAPPDWDEGFEFSGGGYTEVDPQTFGAFFEELFAGGRAAGMGGARGVHGAGQDHHARITIDLEDAYRGASRDVTLRVPELDASGRVGLRERSVRVSIPKGVTEGQHIRLAGQGAPGVGQGPPGDLYLEIAIRDRSGYRVEGRDVYVDLPVAPWEAALGAKIDLATPGGAVELTVPRHVQTGKKLRLKGRGIPGRPAGHLYAVVKIVIPPTETARARDLYEELAREVAYDPRARMEDRPW